MSEVSSLRAARDRGMNRSVTLRRGVIRTGFIWAEAVVQTTSAKLIFGLGSHSCSSCRHHSGHKFRVGLFRERPFCRVERLAHQIHSNVGVRIFARLANGLLNGTESEEHGIRVITASQRQASVIAISTSYCCSDANREI
jgi:hypothetical protein